MSPRSFQPIAITGLSALFPQARTLDEFWRLILSGRDCMQDIPPTHWLIEDYYDPAPRAALKTYAKKGAFLKEVPFDPMAYGLPPSSLPATDIAQVLALMLARAVLEDASGGQIATLKLDRTSILLGVASATELISSMSGLLTRPMWIEGMRRAGIPEPQVQEAAQRITALFPEWTENTFPGCLGNVVAGRVANRFNLGGTNCVTDAACASSLAALHLGIGELQLGTTDRVISGGVDALNSIFMFMCFSQTPAMSASGKCSPFSAAADGTMMGEGGGMLCLRRLEDAEREGDAIHAVIRGVGSSSDGRAKSVYAPRPEGQALALERCYELAGYSPATVGLVEAHGTGTAAGDACEAAALKEVFSAANPEGRRWCGLGSIKSQIGHTKGAAGTAGLIKAALALRHGVLPPMANVEAPNPALGLEDSPFYLSTRGRPWIVPAGQPRRASVSSFGFGGTNFHVALEEYRGANVAPRVRAFGADVFLASGGSVADVLTATKAWMDATETSFAIVARDSQRGFAAGAPVRVAIVATTPEELRSKGAKLAAALGAGPRELSGRDGIHASCSPARSGGIAYLFPGQGSQSVGMAAEVPMHFEAATRAWEKFEALTPAGSPSVAGLVYPTPAYTPAEREGQEQLLRRTDHAQPALGAVSLAYLAVMEAAGLQPACTGGHSFGEVLALYAAGVIGWEDCAAICRKRGELMAQVSAATAGAMTAVLHRAADVCALVAEFPDCVMANHNSATQVVIAGPVEAVTRFEAALAARQISFRRLPVATAFHSPVVAAACAPFEAFLGGVAFVPASIPVFHNRTAAMYPVEPARARHALARQIAEPVKFADQVRAMQEAGARVFVEVGPGTVLTNLVRQMLGDGATVIPLNPPGVGADVGLLQALANLAVIGVPVSWDFLWEGYRSPRPAEQMSAAAIPVGGYNIGRPYPSRDGKKAAPVLVERAPLSAGPAAATEGSKETTPIPAVRTQTPAPARTVPLRTESSSVRPSPFPAVKPVPAHTSDAIARAHETFLRTVSDAHRAFLAATSGAAVTMPAVAAVPTSPAPLRTDEVEAPAAPRRDATDVVSAAPQRMPAPRPATRPANAVPAPAAVPVPPPAPTPRAVKVPSIQSAAATAATGARSAADVVEVVMATVAEKTGYPREMLQPPMLLEGDLGIDSIKRVEILSAVQKKLPGLPAVDAKVMGSLQTLQAISDYLVQQLSGAPVDQSISGGPAKDAPTISAADLMEVVMKTVADKTGYPRDMLQPAMLLEGDLGIDSIKRVEILSAVQKQLPGLPAVDAKVMGSLQTLQAISDYLCERLGGSATAAPATATSQVLSKAAEPATKSAGGDVETTNARAEPELPVRRYVLQAAPAEAPALATPGLYTAKHLVITDDGLGVAQALRAALMEEGIAAKVVSAVPADADAVVLLDGFRAAKDPAAGDAIVKEAFLSVRALAPTFSQSGGLLVAVQDTDGSFGLSGRVTSAWSGAFAGLAKTAAKEWPRATVRVIDLARNPASAEETAGRLARELLAGGDQMEIGIARDGSRTRPVLVADDGESAGGARPAGAAVVLATGGGRGVTAAGLIALAKAQRAKFALLGRTELKPEPEALRALQTEAQLRGGWLAAEQKAGRTPTPKELASAVADILAQREIRATLAALQAAGSAADYFTCDTTDAAATRRVVTQVRGNWGPVTALIHGAGVLADKLIAEKTPEQFARVFDTKVAGLRGLLAATAEDPLEAIVLFSSVAGRFGNRGQADYAAANEVLNKIAHAEFERRGGKCLVRSINWGPWEGGMVTPELREHFRRQGVGTIPRDIGAAALVHELRQPASRAAIEITIGAGRLDPSDADAATAKRRGETRVTLERLPMLASHVVKGRPVVPIALAAEWMLAAAALARPGAAPTGLRELQVLKPIVLGDGRKAKITLQFSTRELDGGALEVTIHGEAGLQPHYRAIAEFATVDELSSEPLLRDGDWQSFTYDATGVYDGRMFHGPDFQVVSGLVGWSRSAAEVQLTNLPASGGPWRIGPALLDGALQAATIWTLECTGKSSLPMRVAELVLGRTPPPDEKCVCRVRASGSDANTVSDVECVDAHGAVIFALRGIECFHVDSYWDAVKA